METLTNGELKQAITIVFGGWAKSDLHKRVRLFAPKVTIGSMQIRKLKLRFVDKLFYQTFEGQLNRLLGKRKPINRDYNEVTYFTTECTNNSERWNH
ncbi:MAG: hypothetical protein ACTS4Y_00465 [Candidatus Hodgkinia cicadicola]